MAPPEAQSTQGWNLVLMYYGNKGQWNMARSLYNEVRRADVFLCDFCKSDSSCLSFFVCLDEEAGSPAKRAFIFDFDDCATVLVHAQQAGGGQELV